jgi:endoglucanase
MKNIYLLLPVLLFPLVVVYASPPGTITKHIKIDQFGYLPTSKKVAVIVDPQTGYNADDFFNPGAGANQYQVRRWTDDVVVYTGTLTAWKGGATHNQSGDKGWWFDFSLVNTPGSYYIYDVANNVGSYRFEINSNVYGAALKQAARMYFYQRINFPKQPPYTDAKWADAACFEGANQDRAARSRFDKTNPATAKDLHGGWMDAGDYNKYVTFTMSPLSNLLETYRTYPAYFTDDYNIPESGNGIADILDEVKWEIDWLKRMQDASGTNGLLLKLGVDNFNGASPPSSDNNPRYYLPECTSSTLTGCGIFALASTVYKSLGSPAMTTYGNDLLTRAMNAWNRAKITTNNFSSFETACDDQDIKAGDADLKVDEQKDLVVTAAVYLFEATRSAEYKNCLDSMYAKSEPMSFYWWGPYFPAVQKALLRYSILPNANPAVVTAIQSTKAAQNNILSITDYTNETDLYRTHMPDAQYHWNSNEVKANAGLNNFDFAQYNINPAQAELYKEVAESYLHWFHGVNPMGKILMTNMYDYGGDDCVNEFYHTWFGNGTPWDNVFTSTYGPPPGYVPGGVNSAFSISTIIPPAGQPIQKSYKEWNTGWNGVANENAWEITEAGIYTQAAYISLLVKVIANGNNAALPSHVLLLTASRTSNGAIIRWETNDPGDGNQFEVQRSVDGIHFNSVQAIASTRATKNYAVQDPSPEIKNSTVYYRIKETTVNGVVFYSGIVKLSLSSSGGIQVYPNPVKNNLVLNGSTVTTDQLQLRIFDASGKLVYTETWQQPAGTYLKEIAIEKITTGVYWLSVSGRHTHERMKLLKE